jgi:hypothetical protein
MDTISAQPRIDFERHRLDMLLWHAEIHERNGKKQEASKIRQWVAHFVAREERNGTRLFKGDFVKT